MSIDLLEYLKQDVELKPGKVPAIEIKPGEYLYIAQLTADQRDLLELQWVNHKREHNITGDVGFRKFLVTYCLCDQYNNRLFDPGDDETCLSPAFISSMNGIGRKLPLALVARLFDVAHAKTGLSASDIEDLVKNSEASRQDAGNGSKRVTKAKAAKNGSRKRSKTRAS